MELNNRYTIDPDKIAWRIIDEEAVILNLDTGLYYSLDKMGTKIWQLLSEGKSLEDTIDMIASEYEEEEEQRIKHDLLDLVCKLKKEDLIHERIEKEE